MEKKDTFNRNYIVLGPMESWQWAGSKGDSLAKFLLKAKPVNTFESLQKKWFDYWLKGIGDGNLMKPIVFKQEVINGKLIAPGRQKKQQLKNYMLPGTINAHLQNLRNNGFVTYISDPAKPVPYRTLPIEATYGRGSRWYTWQVEDQRFVYFTT